MSVTIPEYGGCLWPLDPACLTDEWEVAPQPVQQRSHILATESMRQLTGYRVGGCPVTIRPNVSTGMCFVPTQGGPGFSPGMDGLGRWVNNCGGALRGIPGSVRLPTPVGPVSEVKVDGVVLDSTDYAVIDNYLVPQNGTVFPATQDVRVADTEPGTMSITYLNALPVDAMGAHAGGLLAVEFAKACVGKGKCRLPKGTRSVTRQGVSYEMTPGLFADGFTGIAEIDAYIQRVNPLNSKMPSRIWSPELDTYRVQR